MTDITNATKLEFMSLCGEYCIDIGIALEDQELVKLLDENASYEEVNEYLLNNF